MRKDGWKNAHDYHPKEAGEYLVEDHEGNRYKAEWCIHDFSWNGRKNRAWRPLKKNKGYDICWWRKE